MLAEISVIPLDKGMHFSKYVASSLDIIDKSGLAYRIGPMGTTIEGSTDKVFDLLKKLHKNMRKKSKRVATYIKIDDRAGKTNALSYKIASVEKKVGRKLRK